MATITVNARDLIVFNDGNLGSPNPTHAKDSLVFSDLAELRNPRLFAADALTILDNAHIKDINVSASDSLIWIDKAERGPTVSAFDLLGLTDAAGMFLGGPGNDLLSFLDTAAVVANKPCFDQLLITEVADSRVNRFLTTSETLLFSDAAQGNLVTCRPVDTRTKIQFASPAINPIAFHELTVPNFGDIRRRDFQRINRRSRANDLIIYRDTDWTISDQFTFKCSNLTAAQKDNFLNFLEFTTGQLVRLRDYENNIWHGFIMNPNMPFTQPDGCRYECEIQFTGTVVG